MSLTGNLEDLPLLDILQIVSFSKKTGFLSIETDAGRGAIVFDEGFVVAAFTWETPPLDPRARGLDVAQRDAILRARIEMALEHLIRLREGLFDFSLTDHVPFDVADRDIEFELLSQGINAQELLLDLARGMDEDRRNTTAAVEASFAEAAADEMDVGLDELLSPPVALEPPPLPAAIEPPPLPPRAKAAIPPPAPVASPEPVIVPKAATVPWPSGDPTTTLPLKPTPVEVPP